MFKSVLEKISRQVEGVLGALIVARDGIIIEQVTASSEINFELLAGEFAAIVKGLRRFARGAELGGAQEFCLQTDKARLLSMFITEEYYLLLVLDPSAGQGHARYELHKAHILLENEFAG